MTEHNHAEVLRVIADGKEVQARASALSDWEDITIDEDFNPFSDPKWQWRIKPEPKPDFKTYLTVRKGYTGDQTRNRYASDTVCFTFDGETGKLKSAVVLE